MFCKIKSLFSFVTVVSVIIVFASTVFSQADSRYEEKEVQYLNGNVNLAGSLLLPKISGEIPAVVFVHGSGNSDRNNSWTKAYAESLAGRGIAVLHPDKRGSGKSQGDWRTASFTELADDAVAAVKLLLNNPRIDKNRIGAIGFSQGGHIIPIVAVRSSNIAFVIDISGSTVPILEQITDEIVLSAKRANLTEKQIDILKDINSKGIRYGLTGKGWDEYQSALNSAKNGELKGHKIMEPFPTEPDDWRKDFIRAIGDFDPIPFWKQTTVPILFIYGGQDTQIKVFKSIRRIEENLGSNKRNYTVMVFNSSGHGLFRNDLIAFITQWIMDKGVS